MSSNASSSGIESDTDSSPSLNEDKDTHLTSDIHNVNDESIATLKNDNDDEGFVNMNFEAKKSTVMSDIKKQSTENLNNKQIISIVPKSIRKKSCHYPFSTRNPYDDDASSSSLAEDWDEECKVIEPYYFPRYIRRAQWPNHWRWTPPLGIRRTCTQQLHRNLGFQPSGLYDDIDSLPININLRHFTFDFQ
ncbi:unnamed protein product [Rotaria magnacalcarata]|uniref:Uncharacterized protein n=3 Tax=Rotaria magnacalcarata TaxID=392030 RepID=A0A814DDJ4_9BILA|nr:unnamed protein product [Rotaria magnacalcarata]CAF1371092.1 unnamed protein product [Rotaria magnacalcarata]CAF1903385.1 unnamed protein product [Rotaria magnacalcarata]CAF4263099.1 unnamed protein product [Rotaria magnacalcarata]